MEPRTDRDLIDAARGGDRRAVEELLERHQGRIFRFGMRMCRDPEDAKDVLQDTMIAVARNVGEFRGDSALSTWLWTIARSACARKRRRRGAARPAEPFEISRAEEAMESEADPSPAPDEAAAGRQVEEAVERAVDSLAPMYREVLMLRDVEGLTAPEVAKILGIRIEAVKSRLHRARLAVREKVAPLLGVPRAPAGAEPEPASECPDVLTLLSRHVEGDMTPESCAELEKHVAACGKCRTACDSLRKSLALCSSLPSPDVPPEIRETVRGTLRAFLEKQR